MSNLIIRIHDLSTNEVIDREMTAEEYSAYLAQQEIDQAASAAAAKEAADKATARAALLTKLGLTEDEAKLLLGAN